MCLGLATGYIKPKEERTTSLLKPYTNNDKLTDMSLEERADFLGKAPWCNQNCSYDDSCNNCFREFLKKEVQSWKVKNAGFVPTLTATELINMVK